MKSDIYLTLCLEQAASSPLRYRHGCIIVRGGKVIGQGFSDYRSGFNGGALKTGRLPSGGNQSAIVGLKMKQKLKLNHKGTNTNDGDTFKPFEGMGGGHLVNTPLSMHSEMMAIHAALNASSTSASSAVLSIKPYLKLSGDSKRKAQLRRDAVKLYVEQICKAALAQSAAGLYTSSSSVQEWRFEADSSQPRESESCAASMLGQAGRGVFVGREQYRETPTEEEQEPPTPWQLCSQFTTQAGAPTACT